MDLWIAVLLLAVTLAIPITIVAIFAYTILDEVREQTTALKRLYDHLHADTET